MDAPLLTFVLNLFCGALCLLFIFASNGGRVVAAAVSLSFLLAYNFGYGVVFVLALFCLNAALVLGRSLVRIVARSRGTLLMNRDFHESLVVGALTSAACVLASHLGYRLEAVVRHQDFADPLQLAVAVSAFPSIVALVLGHRVYRVIARRADRRAATRWLRAMNDLDMA